MEVAIFLQAQALNNRSPDLAFLHGRSLDENDAEAVEWRARAAECRSHGATFTVGDTTISRLGDILTFNAPTTDRDAAGRLSRVLVTTTVDVFQQETAPSLAQRVRQSAEEMGRHVLEEQLGRDLLEWKRKKARRGQLKRLGRAMRELFTGWARWCEGCLHRRTK